MIVLPAPGSSANRNRSTGSSKKTPYTASIWCGNGAIRETAGPRHVVTEPVLDPQRLDPEPEPSRVALRGQGVAGSDNLDAGKLVLSQRHLAETTRRVAEHELP